MKPKPCSVCSEIHFNQRFKSCNSCRGIVSKPRKQVELGKFIGNVAAGIITRYASKTCANANCYQVEK